MPGNPDRRLLECSGSGTTHKFLGNTSSILCNQSVHQEVSEDLGFTVYGQHVRSDVYQPNGGSRSLVLTAQAIDIWSWCLQRKITVSAQYIPGLENVTADYLSRHLRGRTDWVLEPTIKQSVGSTSGGSLCNTLFKATSPFLQLATGPRSRGHRCFCTELTNIQGFAHPPWCLNL